MAKIEGPLMSIEAHGSIGSRLTFSSRKTGQQVRFQNRQVDAKSSAQLSQRENFLSVKEYWNTLSPNEKEEYNQTTIAKRLNMTGYNYFLWYYLAEKRFKYNAVPTMTSNTTPEGESSASTKLRDDYKAWNAFNKTNSDNLDCWLSASTTYPEWLQYEFETSHKITKYTITTRNDAANPSTPRSWVLYGSNTGNFTGEETTLDSRTDGFPSDQQNETREFSASSPGDYKYYRLHITAGWRADYVGIGMFKLYEESFTPE